MSKKSIVTCILVIVSVIYTLYILLFDLRNLFEPRHEETQIEYDMVGYKLGHVALEVDKTHGILDFKNLKTVQAK